MPDERCHSAACFVLTAKDWIMAALATLFGAAMAFPWGSIDGWTKIMGFIGLCFGTAYAYRRWRNECLEGEIKRLQLEAAERASEGDAL